MGDKLKRTIEHGQHVIKLYERSTLVWLGSFVAPVVTEVYYAMPAPDEWPKVQVRARRGILARYNYKRGRRRGLMLDDENFNQAFKVTTSNEDFAIMLLSPAVQEYMLRKRTVDWSVGEGTIKLWYRGSLKKSRIKRAVERLVGFHELIAEELFDYTKGYPSP
ncbi:MAG: hypothetical protein JKY96_01535 [Phycisphaerales bacterium]|nr:hypothetical protein [Phycisphaerales bacterium]